MNLKKRVRFSNVISTVKVDRGTLEIKQLRWFALTVMILFLGTIIYFAFNERDKLPFVIQLSISFGCFILIWGIYDVATTKIFFRYNYLSDLIQLKAKRKSFKTSKNGSGKNYLSLRIKKSLSPKSRRDFYSVILYYEDDLCEIPFVLSGSHTDEKSAKQSMMEWREKLKLKATD